jgi:hypothetical protein
VAGPVHPSRHMPMARMRVAHADSHAAAILAARAEWRGAMAPTRLVWPVESSAARCVRRACRLTASPSPTMLATCATRRLSSRLQRVPVSANRHASGPKP